MLYYYADTLVTVDHEYIFDTNTTELTVQLISIDDLIIESEKLFTLCLQTLRTINSDVQLITEVSPQCATIHIQDDEGFYNNYICL